MANRLSQTLVKHGTPSYILLQKAQISDYSRIKLIRLQYVKLSHREKVAYLLGKFVLQLAQTVVDAGAIAHLAQMILNPDAKLKVFFQCKVHSSLCEVVVM